MSDPNEGQATLIKQVIEPQKTQQHQNKAHKDDKKLQKNQSDVRSSINRSRSDDSLKNQVNLADSIVPDQGMGHQQQAQQNLIPQDYFYSDLQAKQFEVTSDSPINQNVAKLDPPYGHDSFKNYNAHILDRDTIIYASGISYTIYNHFTREKTIFYSKARGGIGAVAVHPSRKYFAVAEKGVWPNVFIYQYPSLKLYRVIRKGTQKSFSCINFSGSGDMFATIGSDPDFLLTVWDWKQQRMLLKSKAFSQDIYRVNFSQFNQKWITTSGTGHIRFWRIASTFTGMKLKGDIGKFGQFQLSDVVSFAQFQDSNVVSSSQYGKLLLWQGNLIKSVVSINQNTPCHKGQIQFVKLVKNRLISAGSDGYIRFWDGQAINTGQSDQHFNLFIKPQKQIYFQAPFGGPAHIVWIDMDDQFWIVQDALGRTWKYQQATDHRTQLLRYNSGKITDFALSPLNNCLVSTGQDGVVRLWDYGSQKQFYNKSFPNGSQATCIEWLPFSKKNQGRMLAVGFSDGIVRFIYLDPKGITLVKAFKVHKTSIIKLKCNRDGTILTVCDSAGSLFFISLDSPVVNKIVPYCLFQTGFKINDLCWDRNGEKILLACNDGKLHQIFVPKQKQCDYAETYLRKFQSRSFIIKMMDSQKPNREQLQLQLMLKKTKGIQVDQSVLDVQWQPAPILNAIYYDTDCSKVLCSVDGKYLGYFYIVDFNKERPISSIEVSKNRTSYLGFSQSHDLIFAGFRNGSWEVRNKHNPNYYLKKLCFDQDYGIVRKVTLNIENTALLSASEDGTLLCHKFDFQSFKKGVRGDSVQNVQISIPNVILGISTATFGDAIDLSKQPPKDITDNTIYGLQDQKLKAEQDMKMTQAQKIKAKKIKKIKQLQQMFKQIVTTNNNQKDNLLKLTPEQLLVDPQYTAAYQKKMDEQEQQTKKVLQWDQYKSELARKKLEDYVINQLQYRKFSVKGIKIDTLVSSFKLKKLSPYVLQQLEKIEKILKQQVDIAQKRMDKKSRTSSSFTNTKNILQIAKQKQTKKGGKQQNQQHRNKIRQAQAQFQKQLAIAVATKGDYKLKCDPKYVVPQNQRLNVSRKKKHLFLHYQYLFLEKKQFNDKLNKLRQKKLQIVDKLWKINKSIQGINKKLGQQQKQIIIQIDSDLQQMQAQIKITDQDIQQYIILKQKQKQANKKGGGGMGMGGGKADDAANDANKNQQTKKKKKNTNKRISKIKQQQGPTLNIKPRPNLKIRKSDLQQQVKQIQKIKLLAQKQKIKNDLQKQIKKFDEDLKQLYNVKKILQNDLTLVQMKILTYAQQFIIFRDMQNDDNQLMQQLNTFGQQKQKFQDNFIKLTNQISQIQTILQQLKKKYQDQKKILKQFVYPQDDQMRQRILRYYKIRQRKRINKLKKQAQQQQKQKQQNKQNQDQDQQQQQEQEQQQSQQSQDQFEDQDQKPDITVIENDHKNFERVRKICQYDQKIEQNAKKKTDLQRQRTQITKQAKNLDMKLQTAQNSLKQYQKRKLQKTNQLIVSYPIKLSQIQYLVKAGNKHKLLEQFNQAILFTNKQFERLSHRIQQLITEKVDIEKKQKTLKKKQVKLKQTVEKASQQIQAKRKQYEQKQLLKFGSTFELDKLKDLQPNSQVLQTRQLYKKQEREVSKKIQQIKQQLQQRKRQLLQAKKQNTKVITDITDLGQRQNQLKKKLDSTNKQLFKNYDASKKDQLEKQRQNLKDLIKFLSKEIQDLKTQIGLFKRKGGHIYTMVTSNKKNFS